MDMRWVGCPKNPVKVSPEMPHEETSSETSQPEFIRAGQRVILASSERMDGVADGSVRLFITSPPYWNLKDYGGPPNSIGMSSYEDYLACLGHVWNECYRKALPSAVLVVNVNNRRYKKRFYPIALDIARTIRGWVLWDYNTWYVPNALPQPKSYMERLLDNKCESLLVFTKDGSTDYKFHKPRIPQKYLTADPRSHKKNSRGRCLGNVIRIPAYRPPNVKEMGYHIAAFPEELVAFYMEMYTDPGDVVLDPFVGSGTTLKVARVMQRQGIGFELNDKFKDLILARIDEEWSVPDWRNLDIISSSTNDPGVKNGPRKVQFRRTQVRLHEPGRLF